MLFLSPKREQEYYQERNLTHPKRCKPCRDARRSNFGGPKGAGGERQRFEITCDQCGKTDTVPFKPSTAGRFSAVIVSAQVEQHAENLSYPSQA